jgi:hypothetical protein
MKIVEKAKAMGKKKLIAIATVSALVLGGAQAGAVYNGGWDNIIHRGVDHLFNIVFPEIAQKTNAKEAELKAKVPGDTQSIANRIYSEVVAHKNYLIKRNEDALVSTYNSHKARIEAKANEEANAAKTNLTAEADEELAEGIANIEAAINAEFEKLNRQLPAAN